MVNRNHHNFKNKTGERFITNEGFEVEIIEYFGSRNSTILFTDGTIVTNKEYGDLVKGTIKHPFHKSVFGVGFMGQGKYKGREFRGETTKCYNTWQGMLERCYNEDTQNKHPTYKECSVSEQWHNYQVFAEWFYTNYKDWMQDWCLDKDILVKGNKVYSPKTCSLVPTAINNLLIKSNSIRGKYPIGVSVIGNRFKADIKINGKLVYLGCYDTPEEAFEVYKTAKEKHIKEVADKYKNQITKEVYQALYNYKVEITD